MSLCVFFFRLLCRLGEYAFVCQASLESAVSTPDIHTAQEWQITVQLPDRKTITLAVEPHDPVASVKVQIRIKVGVPSKQQRLYFGVPERLLEDDTATLQCEGIGDRGTVRMASPECKPVGE
jgi:hypothetical protein